MTTTPKRQRKCPTCGKSFRCASVTDWPAFPFCTERCRQIDLGAWLSEEYKVVDQIRVDPEALDQLADEAERKNAGGWLGPDSDYED